MSAGNISVDNARPIKLVAISRLSNWDEEPRTQRCTCSVSNTRRQNGLFGHSIFQFRMGYPSFCAMISLTILGFALPLVAFITRPTKKPSSFVWPER